MSINAIKILRSGKNTSTLLRFNNGAPEHTLLRAGAGQFFPGEFSEISDAKEFAGSELQKDPSAILYIMTGDQILDTVMNHEYQSRKHKRASFVYAVVSTFAVFTIAICISLFVMPFTSLLAHSLFTGGMTLLYLAALSVMGTRSFEALIVMVMFFVMAVILAPNIKKIMTSNKAPESKARKLAEPQR